VASPQHARASIARGELEAAARSAGGDAPVRDLLWLDAYDDHYYDREGLRALPVLRVKYDDPAQTWIYLDPGRGAIALVSRAPDRLNRWLYHGLHSLDFSWLIARRPAWDAAVIVLSLGGIAGAATSLVPAWRRLRRLAQPMFRIRTRSAPSEASRPVTDVSGIR
jgi:hypothetical protein